MLGRGEMGERRDLLARGIMIAYSEQFGRAGRGGLNDGWVGGRRVPDSKEGR